MNFPVDTLVQMHPDHCPVGWDRNQIGVIITPPSPFQHTVQWGEATRLNYAHHLVPYAPPRPRKFVSERTRSTRPYDELVVDLQARLALSA